MTPFGLRHTVANSSAAESTSNASTMSIATNISKQEVADEILVEPAVAGNPKLLSYNMVPYGAESSEENEKDSKSSSEGNCNAIPSNGIVIWKVVHVLEISHSSCQSSEEERSQPE